MNQLDALRKQATNIQTDFRHEYYDENVALYEKYLILSTGKGWESFLHRLTSRVSLEDFQEIVNVTIDICKSIVKNLCHVFYRVTRSIGIKIEYNVEDAGKKEDFDDILKTFGRYGFEGYMEKRFTDFCKIDPNGFVVVEFKPTDGAEYARPYPVEYYSPDVLDYDYELNKLVYVCVKQDVAKKTQDGEKVVSDYTIYTNEGAVKFIARPDLKTATPFDYNKTDYVTGDIVGLKERIEKDDRNNDETVFDVFQLLIPEAYDLENVPAICTGYLPDESHRGETYLNFFDNAVPIIQKAIKTNAESDICAAKHAFPKLFQFVPPCPANCDRNEHGVFCIDNKPCPTCGGSGYFVMHRSGLDVVNIPLTPENAEKIDLANLAVYAGFPLESIKYLWEHVGELIEMAKRVMYNSEMFSRETIAQTATAKLLEMQNMVDTLYTYAVHYASVYEYLLNTISGITDIKIKVTSTVSKDLGLLSKGELFEMLSLANTAGANSAVIEAINDALAYAFFGNSPAYKNYLERKKLIPFQNKSKEQVMLILSSLPPTHKFRLMFQFGEEVLTMLEATYPDWSTYTMEKKQALIDEQLKLIEDEINSETKVETPVLA